VGLPTIAINNATGSDTAASGAGPATAITGSLAATHANTTVNITDTVALGGVATDGSAVLWVSTSSGRQWSAITAITGSSGAWVVTVGVAYGTTQSGATWAIGGKRATLNGSLQLGLDCGAGWTIDLQTNDTLTATFRLTPVSPVAGSPTTFTSTSATRPVLATATNNVFGCDIQNSSNLIISHINFKCTAATPGNGIGPASSAGNAKNILVSDCVIDGFKWGIGMEDPGSFVQVEGMIVRGTEVKNCTVSGISAASTGPCPQISRCYIHDNLAYGVNCLQGFGNRGISIDRSVISHNGLFGVKLVLVDSQSCYISQCDFSYNNTSGNATGGGLYLAGSAGSSVEMINSILYGNAASAHGFGLYTDGSGLTAFLSANNAFGGNPSGDRSGNGAVAGPNDVTLTVDPHVSTTDSALNTTAGGGMLCRGAGAVGIPNATASTARPDIGAFQMGTLTMSNTIFKPHPDNVSTTLASAYTAGGTSLTLASGTGAAFGNTFPMLATVAQASSYGSPAELNTIYSVTARSGDVLTITAGGQEGTIDRNYAIGDRVDVRWTDGLAKAIEGAVNSLETTTTNIQTGLVVNQGTITSNIWAINTSATWNAPGTTVSHWVATITDTASSAASYLQYMSIVGQGAKWAIDKTGKIINGAADGGLITTGTIVPARLAAAGTPSITTWLRGDGAWASFWPAAVAKSSIYTMSAQDRVVLVDPSSGSWTLTLPAAAAAVGNEYLITNNVTHATNTVTIQRQGSDGVNSSLSVVLSCTTQFKYYRLLCVSTSLFITVGSA
jgi:hypothetical protein